MIVYFCVILWEILIAPYMVMQIRQLLGHIELPAELPEVETNEAINEDDEGENELADSLEEYCVRSTSQSVSCLNENKKDPFAADLDVTLENISTCDVDDKREKEEEVLCPEEDNRPTHEVNNLQLEYGFEEKVEASDVECDSATESTFDDGMKSEFNRNDIQEKNALAESFEHIHGGLVDDNSRDIGVNAAISDELRSAALPEEVIEVVNAASENETSELNNSKVSNEITASATRSVLTSTVFRRSLECQYGLLDQLLGNECLMMQNVLHLEGFNTETERVNKLLEFISCSNINKFEQGLEATNQIHLVNFIRKNGIREPPEDIEWPLSDCEIAPIIKSYPDLVQYIFNHKLIDELLAKECISCVQENSVLSKATNEEKNRELLRIIIRRSVRQLDIFLDCLRDHHPEVWNQLHAQGEGVYAVNLDVKSHNLAQYLDDFKEKKQEILRRADDPALEVDLLEVDDRIYMVAKAKVGEEMGSETIRPSSQSAQALVDNVQNKIIEVLGNDDRNAGNITSGETVISEEIRSDDEAYFKELLKRYSNPRVRSAAKEVFIHRERLEIGNLLGKGRFGRVYAATLRDELLKNPQQVAVKTIEDWESNHKLMENFLHEGIFMKNFNHPHLLGLIGICWGYKKEPMIILPFMANGDLRTYVKDKRKSFTARQLLLLAQQIAEGMAYLSSLNYVHGNLAARNCMIDDKNVVKVADFHYAQFGLSFLEFNLPIRWMALESLFAQFQVDGPREYVFTIKSDVWSFGVLMWELMTRGGVIPYHKLNDFETRNYLASGRRLPKPENCPDKVYGIMTDCWQGVSENRPSFSELLNRLEFLLNPPKPGQVGSTQGGGGGIEPMYINMAEPSDNQDYLKPINPDSSFAPTDSSFYPEPLDTSSKA